MPSLQHLIPLATTFHIFEPLPPFLIDNSGQFSPVNITTLKKLGLFKTLSNEQRQELIHKLAKQSAFYYQENKTERLH
jgi:hypothetical protein